VAGITILDALNNRMVKAAKGSEDGNKIYVEQIQEVRESEGVHGVHILAIEWEQMISQINELAGLLLRPKIE
jgi:methylenetetrahydrofolate reductase (NADPH)